MLDYRIYTFLKLCQLLNYRQTADALNMTQPAVTQHVQMLEAHYHCRLFAYNGRKLTLTEAGRQLETYARSAAYNEQALCRALKTPVPTLLRAGATKTIGDYVLGPQVAALAGREDLRFSLLIDNTQRLLRLLDDGALDIAVVEGVFDKTAYGWQLLREEPFIGICAADHPFAGKAVPMEALFSQTLLLREPGSGTRGIFERMIESGGWQLSAFPRMVCISSFSLILQLAASGSGVSFVYEAVAKSAPSLGTFTVKNLPVRRGFYFVYLKNTDASRWIPLFTQ